MKYKYYRVEDNKGRILLDNCKSRYIAKKFIDMYLEDNIHDELYLISVYCEEEEIFRNYEGSKMNVIPLETKSSPVGERVDVRNGYGEMIKSKWKVNSINTLGRVFSEVSEANELIAKRKEEEEEC